MLLTIVIYHMKEIACVLVQVKYWLLTNSKYSNFVMPLIPLYRDYCYLRNVFKIFSLKFLKTAFVLYLPENWEEINSCPLTISVHEQNQHQIPKQVCYSKKVALEFMEMAYATFKTGEQNVTGLF